MGTSVPKAVVVSAMAVARKANSFSWKLGSVMHIAMAIAKVTSQVISPWRPCPPVSCWGVYLIARKQEEKAETEVG